MRDIQTELFLDLLDVVLKLHDVCVAAGKELHEVGASPAVLSDGVLFEIVETFAVVNQLLVDLVDRILYDPGDVVPSVGEYLLESLNTNLLTCGTRLTFL